MAKKKIKPRELSAIQDEYLARREEILKGKVNSLAATLFDKVYNHLSLTLIQNNGLVTLDNKNNSIVNSIDEIFNQFRNNENAAVIKGFVGDLQAITPMNARYFKTLTDKNVTLQSEYINKAINKKLGIAEDGSPVQNGFVDKFLRDKKLLKTIKKTVNQGITQGKGIQELRAQLKEVIQGNLKQPLSGGLQQYYRNFAYDTYIQVDRQSADMFAKDLGLRYFYYTGGLITTSRAFCEKCNGMLIDSFDFKNLIYENLKPELQSGIPDGTNEDWVPLDDLGGYGCRHRKRYVLDSVAEQNLSKILNINILLT